MQIYLCLLSSCVRPASLRSASIRGLFLQGFPSFCPWLTRAWPVFGPRASSWLLYGLACMCVCVHMCERLCVLECNFSPRLGQDCCGVHPGRKSKTWELQGGQREKRQIERERDGESKREREGRTAESVGKGKVGKRESNGQRVERLFLTCSPWKRDVSLCQFAPLTSL